MTQLSKFAVFGYVVLWIAVVIVLSIARERFLNLPETIAQGITMFIGMVAFYPILKWWESKHPPERRMTLASWILAMLLASTMMTALQYIVDRW